MFNKMSLYRVKKGLIMKNGMRITDEQKRN